MVEISNSFELLVWLKNMDLLSNSPKFWWPNYGTFEVVVGAILTQNTKWQNVEKSLENLKDFLGEKITPQNLSQLQSYTLASLIAPSGFNNQKSSRLSKLAQNINDKFGDFETFRKTVERDWLLAQKGIGQESADAILCYGCSREEMVVDKYTARVLAKFGYEFENYEEIKSWLMAGVNENFDKIQRIYKEDITLNEIYARFHGKIVELSKRKIV